MMIVYWLILTVLALGAGYSFIHPHGEFWTGVVCMFLLVVGTYPWWGEYDPKSDENGDIITTHIGYISQATNALQRGDIKEYERIKAEEEEFLNTTELAPDERTLRRYKRT